VKALKKQMMDFSEALDVQMLENSSSELLEDAKSSFYSSSFHYGSGKTPFSTNQTSYDEVLLAEVSSQEREENRKKA